MAIVKCHIIDWQLWVGWVSTWVVTHDGLPQCLCHLGFADKVVLGQGHFVAWELIGFCTNIIGSCTHHKGTSTNTHHFEADAINCEGERWVGQYLKVESDNTITAIDILECVGIRTRLGVGVAIPRIGFACANGIEGLVGGIVLTYHTVGIQYEAEGTATTFLIFSNSIRYVSARYSIISRIPSRTTATDISEINTRITHWVYLRFSRIDTLRIVYILPNIARHIVNSQFIRL